MYTRTSQQTNERNEYSSLDIRLSISTHEYRSSSVMDRTTERNQEIAMVR